MKKGKITVWIESEGSRLPEYQVEIVDDKTVACYIPSEAGKTFKICWRGSSRHDKHVTTVRSCIDGHKFGGTHFPPGKMPTAHANSECPLDDDALASNIGPMGDPGTIEVHFAHVMEQGQVASQYSFKCDTPRVVHEGSKKMGMHCVSFGEPLTCKVESSLFVSKLANEDEPFYARFIFRYRPNDVLRAQDIIPSESPNAGPNEHHTLGQKRRSNTGAPEEGPNRKRARTAERSRAKDNQDVDALEEELKSIQARAQAIQRELQARVGSPPSHKVKSERGSGARGGVVDLTKGTSRGRIPRYASAHLATSLT
ncbi:hypothetical protein FOMPIDRAFT_92819 [Fomitopsis schrenkii]|uniref:DUF7918 domain-containing protein n=1 Tax=Fomitopsis schrenkii TaxID=2126942 RepID=S8DPP0_FOMSC|nr:hypothetical protein FOMPIDRAFT_92819 [Fomitopsis schrenkii]